MTFDPQPGDSCNWQIWTDVEPCTVIARTPQTVTVRVNKTEIDTPPTMVPGGFAAVVTEPATWRILDELQDRTLVFTKRAHGGWKLRGSSIREPGNVLRPGFRKVYDYGF